MNSSKPDHSSKEKEGFFQSLRRSHFFRSILRWADGNVSPADTEMVDEKKTDWLRIIPFIALHLGCLGVIWVGFSWTAVAVAVGLYMVRMFAITGIYHRYFSHRTYETYRPVQFAFALLGTSAVQRGPLWWASHHRHHHRHSDQPEDIHSPVQHGFLWSHMGWFTSLATFPTKNEYVKDWNRFPELRFLNRYSLIVPVLLAVTLYYAGEILADLAPGLGTSGMQLVVWGFFVSTLFLFHATATINSLDHLIGRRRYNTSDDSRNNWFLAIITLGEGWHNNHHHYPIAARQGFFWWELDITYMVLKLLSFLGIIRKLRPVPIDVRQSNLVAAAEPPGRTGGA